MTDADIDAAVRIVDILILLRDEDTDITKEH